MHISSLPYIMGYGKFVLVEWWQNNFAFLNFQIITTPYMHCYFFLSITSYYLSLISTPNISYPPSNNDKHFPFQNLKATAM